MSARMDALGADLGGHIDRVEARIDRQTYWLMGLLAAVTTSVIATIVTRIV